MIDIVEVGPRDGLQAEDRVLDVATRVELIRRCARAGARRIEVCSFAHPSWVPQMAGAEEICTKLEDRDFSAIGLVLNARGLDRAIDAGNLDEVNLIAYAANGYCLRNTGAPADERNREAADLVVATREAGFVVSVTIGVAFGDPIDGEVAVGRIAEIAGLMGQAGAHEVALGDTIGSAVPADVEPRIAAVRDAAPGTTVRCHFHNTRNTGYANAVAASSVDVDALDASVGGFGGSPFSPMAGGNVATEDLAWLLERSGIRTGLDIDALAATGTWVAGELGSPLQAMQSRTGSFPPAG